MPSSLLPVRRSAAQVTCLGPADTVAVVRKGDLVRPVALRLDAGGGRWIVTVLGGGVTRPTRPRHPAETTGRHDEPDRVRGEDKMGSRESGFEGRRAIQVPEPGGAGPGGSTVRGSRWLGWRRATGRSCGRRAPPGSASTRPSTMTRGPSPVTSASAAASARPPGPSSAAPPPAASGRIAQRSGQRRSWRGDAASHPPGATDPTPPAGQNPAAASSQGVHRFGLLGRAISGSERRPSPDRPGRVRVLAWAGAPGAAVPD